MKKIIYLYILISALTLVRCTDSYDDIVPDLEGEPAAGIIDIDIESIDSNEMIISVDLFAVDHLGGFIQNLGINDFEIDQTSNNGQEIELIDVKQLRQEERGPFSATLLFDQSGSISGTDPQDARIEAGIKFAEIVSDGDEASVVAFTSGSSYTSPYEILTQFTDDKEVLIPPIQDLANREGGGTPLYISTAAMCDHTGMNGKNDNKAIIAFTDGADTDSGVSIDQLIEKACENDVRIFTVGLGGGVSLEELSEIAFETGGAVMLAENAIQLVSLYSSMGELLHGRAEFFKMRIKLKNNSSIWQVNNTAIANINLVLNEDYKINFPIRKRVTANDKLKFYEQVPICPCNYDDIIEESNSLCTKGVWRKCGKTEFLDIYHYGAQFEARWIPIDDDAPGQQCTYDTDKKLITGGVAAGTPDKDAPGGCGTSIFDLDPGHYFKDVKPWEGEKSCVNYLKEWVPNDGLICDENIINGFNHMLKAVGDLDCESVTRLFILADTSGFDPLLGRYFKNLEDVPEDLLKTHIKDISTNSALEDSDKAILNQLLINLG